ncbi:hypothetical protein GGX14DRAFT_559267 [Mycena pura]|uniref:Uncharacterized protein n=1 Tax=Mycena pura TaxID=153505 RepID=A0AAD6VUR8_9AGAR|nr:hypothetical protein GGX14DRAFT_559267 [Mycena pura]
MSVDSPTVVAFVAEKRCGFLSRIHSKRKAMSEWGRRAPAVPPGHTAVPPHHAAVPPRALQVPALKVTWALQLLAVPPHHAVVPPRALRVPALKRILERRLWPDPPLPHVADNDEHSPPRQPPPRKGPYAPYLDLRNVVGNTQRNYHPSGGPATTSLKHSRAESVERPSKKQRTHSTERGLEPIREQLDDEPPKLLKLQFKINDVVTKVFYATNFVAVDKPTRADHFTLYFDTDSYAWRPIPHGKTPVLATEDNRGRYQSKALKYGL